ncbi:MAG: AmmeMemoRadiSam system radical SAM enzyme [Deltaproteobacteria bacterium]|nr:AmmeMemoRadiSam system radical SAM enzyme [Deltaproteobacteria bacterium]
MKEAYLYEKTGGSGVHCRLCSHRCRIKDGKKGICHVRENRGGTLFSLVYGKVVARHVDPIEKKPLFHFLPGSRSYSVATVGCNFRCLFCQNADISQMPVDHGRVQGEDMTPKALVDDAMESRSASIAYTYTEPTIYFELALDTARLAAAEGIRNVFVTNGYMTRECLEEIHPDLHAANVDLKAFTDRFYKEQCGAGLDPVLRSIETMKAQGVWVEVTTLLIPGWNDDPAELRDLAGFIAGLDPGIPWHISRFHPTYRLMSAPPTPPSAIHRARDIGREAGLQYVYTGNLPGDEGENTACHACGERLIERWGFAVKGNRLRDGACPACGEAVPGVWA